MEKFDLEKALAGHPVKLRCGIKVIIVSNANLLPCKNSLKYPLTGYTINKDDIISHESWSIEGKYSLSSEDKNGYDIVGMWSDGAELISIELPRPLHRPELNSKIYIISQKFTISGETYKDLDHQEKAIKQGRVFKTEEDAQMWLDALVNSRG